ncbi:pyrroline-5-carboxylate reductase [Ponticaulis sp.]|uniref:pyrroline-5-carboxylate reductase n=1 Tax=Ponticaulis sp. TaxID=2020902 RepID=UPI000B67A153|nr:pyrroline-5-carboxylate reductase [Ponticaulis sp.]MAI89166.1 pyrroline-5-carboxylate reductase [Ponticaulis sp.]OUY01161.1 MAG: pyrroline-5-carboxylate reductase [Hyphomonadaceae bacterium TMED5]|tara:strand:+ start:102984 stop:103787 length:804 start_codon:yes stop_codon:yes gene_type:complete
MTQKIALLGCGRMGSAMAQGWLNAEDKPQISVYAPRPTPLVSEWAGKGEVVLNPVREPADILVVAVKPQVFGSILDEARPLCDENTLVISVMAAWSVDRLVEALGTRRIVRALPSTPGSVGKGVTLLSCDESVSEQQLGLVNDLLSPLGWVEGPMPEETLQVAMTISGSGPAYIFNMVEALAAAGIANGLEPELAMRLARQGVIGAGALLDGSPEEASALREAVTSPKGVTAAALDVFMGEGGLTPLATRAIAAAVARDQALARGED